MVGLSTTAVEGVACWSVSQVMPAMHAPGAADNGDSGRGGGYGGDGGCGCDGGRGRDGCCVMVAEKSTVE
jgi:hypothetical protein